MENSLSLIENNTMTCISFKLSYKNLVEIAFN